MLTVADISGAALRNLLMRFRLDLRIEADGAAITGSYWGGREAGVVGCTVFARRDTPLHSLLHEACHVICMDEDRRDALHTDAGGDDLEEAAVCYLQILLAGHLPGAGRRRLMGDMDDWGYSFRLGSTRRWFERDAGDARAWLARQRLTTAAGEPAFRLRGKRKEPVHQQPESAAAAGV